MQLLDYTEFLSLARKTGDLRVSKQQCASAPKGRNLVISLFSADLRLPREWRQQGSLSTGGKRKEKGVRWLGGGNVQKIKFYFRSKLLSRQCCWKGTLYTWTLLPQCSQVFHISLYLLKDFYFPITVTTALTAQSGSSYVPQIRDIAVEGISQNPIFHPRPLTFAIFPFPSYILHLFFWTRGSTDHGQFRTRVLIAKLADHTGKIRIELKLSLSLLSSQWIFMNVLGTCHLHFYFQITSLQFRIYRCSCIHR